MDLNCRNMNVFQPDFERNGFSITIFMLTVELCLPYIDCTIITKRTYTLNHSHSDIMLGMVFDFFKVVFNLLNLDTNNHHT
jgi:hypothetical protein